MTKKKKSGGCHCGSVKFEVHSEFKTALRCNCSICSMKGFIHLIVGKHDFNLLTPMDHLENYQFETKTAQHLFCKKCGISSFYIPRSHPDGFSVNLRCIENVNSADMEIEDFDGRNWESNINKIT